MATDTRNGIVEKFEDFLVTALADLPEIDSQGVTNDTPAVVAGGADGRVRHSIEASNDDDIGGISFGALNWTAGDGFLWMEARIIISDITDNRFFVGFGDSIVTTDETMFDAASDSVTIGTQSDAIGLFFDNDATTKNLWAVAAKTDSVTVSQSLGAQYNPVATTPFTLGVYLSENRKSAEFYVNGKAVYRVDSTTTLVGAVDLVPCVVGYEQGTAYTLDTDYLHAKKGRSST